MSEIFPDSRAAFESRTSGCFGSPRSGSTWLLGLLAQHPRVVPMNEPTHRLPPEPVLDERARLSGRGPRLLQTFTLRKVVEHDPAKFFSAEYRDVWMPGLRRLIGDRLRAYVERAPKLASTRGCDPRCQGAERLAGRGHDHGRAAEAALLFLLRDRRDVVDSELASFAVGGWLERAFDHLRRRAQTRSDSTSSPTPRTAGSGAREAVQSRLASARRAQALGPLRGAPRRARRQPGASPRLAGADHRSSAVEQAVDALAFERIKSTGPAQVQPLRDPWRLAREPAVRGRAGSRRAVLGRSSASSVTTSTAGWPESQPRTASSEFGISLRHLVPVLLQVRRMPGPCTRRPSSSIRSASQPVCGVQAAPRVRPVGAAGTVTISRSGRRRRIASTAFQTSPL